MCVSLSYFNNINVKMSKKNCFSCQRNETFLQQRCFNHFQRKNSFDKTFKVFWIISFVIDFNIFSSRTVQVLIDENVLFLCFGQSFGFEGLV